MGSRGERKCCENIQWILSGIRVLLTNSQHGYESVFDPVMEAVRNSEKYCLPHLTFEVKNQHSTGAFPRTSESNCRHVPTRFNSNSSPQKCTPGELEE